MRILAHTRCVPLAHVISVGDMEELEVHRWAVRFNVTPDELHAVVDVAYAVLELNRGKMPAHLLTCKASIPHFNSQIE